MSYKNGSLKQSHKLNFSLYTALVAIIGLVLVLIKILYEYLNRDDNFEWSKVIINVLSEVGLLTFGAALLTLLFGWITKKENIISIEEHLGKELDRLSLQFRKMATDASSVHNFHWTCWLTPLTDSQKSSIEHNDEFWNQLIELQYYTKIEHEELKLIFAAGGNEDGLLKDYFSNGRYLISYKIECDDKFSIDQDPIHSLIYVDINGIKCYPQKKIVMVKNKTAAEYAFKVPEGVQNNLARITIAFRVLKWHAASPRVYIPKQIFQTTDRAEFQLNIDRSIGVKRVVVDTTEITSLSSTENKNSAQLIDEDGSPISAKATIPSIILEGSAVRFELHT